MNRKELVESVARECDLPIVQADAALSAVLGAVVSALAQGGKVTVPGFGTFEVRHRAARSGRNPQTGRAIDIAATDAPAFRPAAAFKQAVSGR